MHKPSFLANVSQIANSSFLRFGMGGIGINIMGVGLNTLLVELLGLHLQLAYAITLGCMVCTGFAVNARIFGTKRATPSMFGKYLATSVGIRIADWFLYGVLTHNLGVPYLVAQLGNTVLFFMLRYKLLKRILTAPASPPVIPDKD